jgi:hypothetical protein
MCRIALLLTLAFASMLDSAARAGSIEISGSGTWDANAPLSALTAPNGTWSFFLVAPDPLPGTTDRFGDYTSGVADAAYLLNGTAVSDSIIGLTYYSPLFGGGFDIDFASGSVVSLDAAQVYDSNTLDLLPGTYGGEVFFLQPSPLFLVGAGSGTAIVGSVPEPSSVIGGGLGLFTVVGLALIRHFKAGVSCSFGWIARSGFARISLPLKTSSSMAASRTPERASRSAACGTFSIS